MRTVEVFQTSSIPTSCVLLELWKDQAALDAHANCSAGRPGLCRRGCGSAPASERTMPTPLPAKGEAPK